MDVSQRKGKVITLFDVALRLDFEGKAGDVEDVTGTINVPEVAHDTEEDEYVFEIDLHGATKEKEPVKDLVRSKILPQLRSALTKLGPALIAEHGKDIQHAPGSGPPTGYITPGQTKTISSSSINKSTNSTVSTKEAAGGAKVNSVAVTDTTEFRTTAEELFVTFTDPQRISAFTRSPPRVWDGAQPGGKFALFGGGVSGEFVELSKPTKIVQKWRLEQWPQGHYSTLSLQFDQDDTNAVTNMRVDWDAVPVGEEDSTKERWGQYYVRSLKTTFGFGTIL